MTEGVRVNDVVYHLCFCLLLRLAEARLFLALSRRGIGLSFDVRLLYITGLFE